MKHILFNIWVVCVVLAAGSLSAQTAPRATAEVTYVASEGIYLNAGRLSGLNVGDTLTLWRGKEIIGRLVITNLSSNSSVSTVVDQLKPIAIGDTVMLSPLVRSDSSEAETDSADSTELGKGVASNPRKTGKLSGSLAFGQQWSHDMSGSDLSHFQPYLRTRLSIRDFLGDGISLNLKHRVRLSHRSGLIGRSDSDQWSNQVYEFSLTTGKRASDAEPQWGIGRVLVSEVRGMGYLDGAFYMAPVADHFRAGIAAGTSPDIQTSDMQLNRRKVGLVGEYRSNPNGDSKLRASIALSGEYQKDTLSREFLYLQTRYKVGELFTWVQSAEIDSNRGWRYKRVGDRLDISNYYTTLTMALGPASSLDLSWDARTNIYTYENKDQADSLFDDRYHRGFRVGWRVRPAERVVLSVTGSLRLRDGLAGNNKSLTLMARFSQFPMLRHSVSLRLSTLKTEFTTAYRPSVTYRWPVSRTIYLNASVTAFVYKTGSATTENYFIDCSTSFLFGGRYSFYGGLRQYIDDELKSLELFTEISLVLGS